MRVGECVLSLEDDSFSYLYTMLARDIAFRFQQPMYVSFFFTTINIYSINKIIKGKRSRLLALFILTLEFIYRISPLQ